MDLYTLLLFESNGGVCGCPGFWESTEFPVQYSPFHRLTPTASVEAARATPPSTTLLPSDLPLHHSLIHLPPSVSISPSSPLELRSPSPTPSGPPKETCFFWYHGECRRGSSCHFAHKTHITWPIIPPPGYVHRELCYLPLCPVNESMTRLMKGCGNKHNGAKDTEMIDIATNEDGGSVTANQANGGESSDSGSGGGSTEDGSDVGEVDMITLSDTSDTTSTSSSSTPTPTPNSPPSASTLNWEPEVTTISHPGTNRRRHLPKFSPLKASAHLLSPKPALRRQAMEGSTADHHPESLHKPPIASKEHQQVCFYWYHQGYCKPRGGRVCPCLHTFNTSVKEINLPPFLTKSHPKCQLPLCPIRLLRENRHNTYQEHAYTQPQIKLEDKAMDSHLSDPTKATIDPGGVSKARSPRLHLPGMEKQHTVIGTPAKEGTEQVQANRRHKRKRQFLERRSRKKREAITHDHAKDVRAEQVQAEKPNKTREFQKYTEKQVNAKARRQRHRQKRTQRKRDELAALESLAREAAGPQGSVTLANPHTLSKGDSHVTKIQESHPGAKREKEGSFNGLQEQKLFGKGARGDELKKREMGVKTEIFDKRPWFFSGLPDTNLVNQEYHSEERADEKRVLVDYDLPSGDERAEWDTDFLRRAFGEIE